MSYLTFVLIPSGRIVVLSRILLSLLYWKNTFFSERNRKRKIKIMILVKTIVQKRWERVQIVNQESREVVPVRQQFLPAIHEVICRDLKAPFSVDSVSVFHRCYRTSKWISWLDTSLTLSGLPPATLSKHLCVKATDNLSFCYCVILLPTIWWFPDHFRTTGFIFVSSSISRMTSVLATSSVF